METKFTPGPWEYGEERGCCREIHADNGPELYAIAQTRHGDPEICEANARLITAAPDMLEELRITRGNVASLGPAGALEPHYEYREWLRMLDEVIAKATGEK